MKKIVLAALLALVAAPAFAEEARTSNYATVGAQVLDQYGFLNSGGNDAFIAQRGVAAKAPSFGYGLPGAATGSNSAAVGAQLITQTGFVNLGANRAVIDQSSAAFSAPGYARVDNTATVGAQIITQTGEANVGSNSATIVQSGEAVSFGSEPVMTVQPYPYPTH